MNRFKTIFCFLILLTTISFSQNEKNKQRLPVEFIHNRIYLNPVTVEGDTLKFYTDSGGGANMIFADAAHEINLKIEWVKRGNDSVQTAYLPEFKSGAKIPSPPPLTPIGEKVMITERHPFLFPNADGFLGARWFWNRVWEFDYPSQSLYLYKEYDWDRESSKHTIELGFQTDENGNKTTGFPRLRAEIDNDSLDLLFDTGATLLLADIAASLIGVRDKEIGTSFIIESIYEKWKKNNPDWLVIENAERRTGAGIIRVPKISVAGYTVGPVWFTVRTDEKFTKHMSKWMDKKIVGALGGSAFQYFKIIIDYPNQKAKFIK